MESQRVIYSYLKVMFSFRYNSMETTSMIILSHKPPFVWFHSGIIIKKAKANTALYYYDQRIFFIIAGDFMYFSK